MTQEKNLIEERNEILQSVIDRLLYLPEKQKDEFTHYLDTLNKVYNIEVNIINGIRIYDIKKYKK